MLLRNQVSVVADRRMNCWENACGIKRRMIQNVGDGEFNKYIGFQSTGKNLNRKKKKKKMKERVEWSEEVKEGGKDKKGNEEQNQSKKMNFYTQENIF